jgi:hypothetical protein
VYLGSGESEGVLHFRDATIFQHACWQVLRRAVHGREMKLLQQLQAEGDPMLQRLVRDGGVSRTGGGLGCRSCRGCRTMTDGICSVIQCKAVE